MRAFRQLAKFGPYLAGSQFTAADIAAVLHFPLISLITQKVFGEDALAGIPELPEYMQLVRQRETVQKVETDRDATFAAMMASRKQS